MGDHNSKNKKKIFIPYEKYNKDWWIKTLFRIKRLSFIIRLIIIQVGWNLISNIIREIDSIEDNIINLNK